jgi:serine/threonine-protein kinase
VTIEAKKYVPIRRIGIGGMAEVFLARQFGEGGFEKQVVLKRPLPEHAADRGLVARLLREARLVAKLDHPGIAAVYEVGRDADGVFIAMEYVEGKDLRAVIRAAREAQRLPALAEVLSIAVELAAALDHAHCKRDADGTPLGIVHRDVSPSNVVIRNDGRVKLLDFGIAKDEVGPTLTGSSELVGKIVYMSPEQTMRWNLDARSDLFALGVVLWELLALRRPFADADHVALLRHIPERDVPSILSLRPELPIALDAVLRRLLARDRDQRYADARALRVDLLAVADACGIVPSCEHVAPLLHGLFGVPEHDAATAAGHSSPAVSEIAPTETIVDPRSRRSASMRVRPRWMGALVPVAFVAVLAGGVFALASRSPAAQRDETVAPVTSPVPIESVTAPVVVAEPPAATVLPAPTAQRAATPAPQRARASARSRSKSRSKPTQDPKPALDPVLPPGFR